MGRVNKDYFYSLSREALGSQANIFKSFERTVCLGSYRAWVQRLCDFLLSGQTALNFLCMGGRAQDFFVSGRPEHELNVADP